MTETVYLDLKIDQVYILAMPFSNKEIFNQLLYEISFTV